MERKIFGSNHVTTKGLEDLQAEAFVSTEHRDRGGDVLKAGGMRILGRVVVLLQHGQGAGGEPIAKPLDIRPGRTSDGTRGIRARMQFFDDADGRRIWKKVVEGYMPSWSIGWRPLKWEHVTERTGEETRVVSEWELLEFSPVSVPMNPFAQTIPDGKGLEQVWFKFLPEGTPVESGYRELSQKGGSRLGELLKSGEPVTVTIPDSLIENTIRRVVRAQLDKARGKVF
jgi:hypothetical protein